MSGETSLDVLLASMSPELRPEAYVFVSVPHDQAPHDQALRDQAPHDQARLEAAPVVTVREAEGTTLVLLRDEADRLGLGYEFVAATITLRVHSALEAVGLTAAVAAALTEAGISCNVVAGFFHDHLFVPHDRAEEAVTVLRALAAGHRKGSRQT